MTVGDLSLIPEAQVFDKQYAEPNSPSHIFDFPFDDDFEADHVAHDFNSVVNDIMSQDYSLELPKAKNEISNIAMSIPDLIQENLSYYRKNYGQLSQADDLLSSLVDENHMDSFVESFPFGIFEETTAATPKRKRISFSNVDQKMKKTKTNPLTASPKTKKSRKALAKPTKANSQSTVKKVQKAKVVKKTRSRVQSSKYRGVSKCSKDGRWQARIRIGSTVKYLGRFRTEIEAAKCYDNAAYEFHGARASPNFKSRPTPN